VALIAPRRPRARRSLAADQSGAVLVIGLFAAALLIGVVYFLLGIGDTLYHTERMQDAADSGAYALGVLHARAMNLVALLNMVELSAVAILSALLAIMAAALSTIGWISSNYYRLIVYGWTIPSLVIVFIQAASAYSSAESELNEILQAANRAQQVLKDELPYIADIKADELVTDNYGPPVQAGYSWPIRSLPIEDGTVIEECIRAFPYAYTLAHYAFRDVPESSIRSRARGYAAGYIPIFCLILGENAQRLEDDADLGGEDFQLRSFVFGGPLRGLGESGVKTATWRADESGGAITDTRDVMSRFSFAQAEYYFDGPWPQFEMLWHMDWRARMRRFRLPPDPTPGMVPLCTLHGADPGLCGEFSVRLYQFSQAIAH